MITDPNTRTVFYLCVASTEQACSPTLARGGGEDPNQSKAA